MTSKISIEDLMYKITTYKLINTFYSFRYITIL